MIELPLNALIELAIESWRLNRWLAASETDRTRAIPRQTARRLDTFLTEREISISDITGRDYEAGLPVEIADTLDDPNLPEGTSVVDEVLSPIVLWRNNVVRHAKVIIRRGAGTAERTDREGSKP
ncbi:MAG TPA: hypothetical protein DCP85_01265 [Elusimicrobia bacterium]|nr:hypothetical protein [Elusimicrobiota bacterium]